LSSQVVSVRLDGELDRPIADVCSSAGASGVGGLLAETLAMRNIVVVVLDIKPIQSETGVLLDMTVG
jgi:hypothetical protein